MQFWSRRYHNIVLLTFDKNLYNKRKYFLRKKKSNDNKFT